MKVPWEYLEDLNEIVYVIDTSNCRLLYMNRYAMETFSLQKKEDYLGKECYRLLQGLPGICPFCNTFSLEEGKFTEWNYFNPLLRKPYLLKDTLIMWEGVRCRMEIAVEAGRKIYSDEEFDYFEKLISDCLVQAHFTHDSDKALLMMISALGKNLKCRRIDIYEKRDGDLFLHSYGWKKDGTEETGQIVDATSIHYLEEWYEKLRLNEPLVIRDIKRLKREKPDVYKEMQLDKSETIILIPFFSRNKVTGALRIDDPDERTLKKISEIGKMLSYFVVSMLERRDLIRHLSYCSYHDQLTDAWNRYALEEHIGEADFVKPTGILVCDVVGLKNINDLQGHEAGDSTLVRVCQTLRKAFPTSTIYRMGGDEFLALCDCETESEFEIQIEVLRRRLAENNCNLSIGSVWIRDDSRDFAELLKIADQRMYQAKEAFYKHPDPMTGTRRRHRERKENEMQQNGPEKDPFLRFIQNYYFDPSLFFRSVLPKGGCVYLFCGDMVKNLYYISDNLKIDFGFEDNLVYDFVTLLEQKIHVEDRQRHIDDSKALIAEKREKHSIRYQIYNARGECVWMLCQGTLKWDEKKENPCSFLEA